VKKKGGNRATEHVGRFSTKYAPFDPSDWLVVDFRPSTFGPYADVVNAEYLRNYWIVEYYLNEKEIKLTKYDNSKKCVLFREKVLMVTL